MYQKIIKNVHKVIPSDSYLQKYNEQNSYHP